MATLGSGDTERRPGTSLNFSNLTFPNKVGPPITNLINQNFISFITFELNCKSIQTMSPSISIAIIYWSSFLLWRGLGLLPLWGESQRVIREESNNKVPKQHYRAGARGLANGWLRGRPNSPCSTLPPCTWEEGRRLCGFIRQYMDRPRRLIRPSRSGPGGLFSWVHW